MRASMCGHLIHQGTPGRRRHRLPFLRWTAIGTLLLALVTLSPRSALALVVTEFSTGITAGANPQGITAGPDGNVWFTEYSGNRIGRITPIGAVTDAVRVMKGGDTAYVNVSFV